MKTELITGLSSIITLLILTTGSLHAEFIPHENWPIKEEIELMQNNEIAIKIAKNNYRKFRNSRGKSGRERIGLSLMVEGLCLLPIRNMAKLYSVGYGFLAGISFERPIMKGFGIGISSGCLKSNGRNKLMERMIMAPILIDASYRIKLARFCDLVPRISIGTSYNSARYRYKFYYLNLYYMLPDDSIIKNKRSLQPVALVGISVQFKITEMLFFSIRCDYGSIIEQSDLIDFVTFRGGIGARF